MPIGFLVILFLLCLQIRSIVADAAESTSGAAQRRRVTHAFGEEKWGPEIKGPSIVQPSYERWKQLKKGLTKAEVKQLLGPVVGDVTDDPDGLIECGIIQTKSPVFPENLSFKMWFSNNLLVTFGDPFNGRFSKTGSPTSPDLIMPHDGMVFDHFPRFLDFRWYPASGVYPMNYEVEIQTRLENEWSSEILEVESPYACTSFVGANEGRWRVRAKNKIAIGEWSPFRRFAFSQ